MAPPQVPVRRNECDGHNERYRSVGRSVGRWSVVDKECEADVLHYPIHYLLLLTPIHSVLLM